jgi:hypothetical protein
MLCRTSGARVHLCAAVPALWAGLSSAAPTALDVAQRRQELYGTRSFETNTWRLGEFGMRIRFFLGISAKSRSLASFGMTPSSLFVQVV